MPSPEEKREGGKKGEGRGGKEFTYLFSSCRPTMSKRKGGGCKFIDSLRKKKEKRRKKKKKGKFFSFCRRRTPDRSAKKRGEGREKEGVLRPDRKRRMAVGVVFCRWKKEGSFPKKEKRALSIAKPEGEGECFLVLSSCRKKKGRKKGGGRR